MIELECHKCGKPSDHYIMVHGKLYIGEDGITDNGHRDNHKFWCLRCVWEEGSDQFINTAELPKKKRKPDISLQ